MGHKKRNRGKRSGVRSSDGNRRGRNRECEAIPLAITSTVSSTTAPIIRPLEINEETRWKPHSLTGCISRGELKETHDSRLLLLLLNKLTPQNFDKVVTDFVSQTTMHSSQEKTRDAVNAIMERASLDMRYAQVYARLCKTLATSTVVDQKATANEGDDTCFRQVLLNSCRLHLSPPTEIVAPSDPSEEDVFEHPDERKTRLILARRRHVGSKRFIGELYNTGVLDTTQTLSFVSTLVQHANESSPSSETQQSSHELALESLCVLLDTCGKTLDETSLESPEMHHCWNTLKEMVSEQTCDNQLDDVGVDPLSFRMKCLILDLLELRESGWSPVRYSSRQRRDMIARPLRHERYDRDEAANSNRKSKRRGKKKDKTVRFVP